MDNKLISFVDSETNNSLLDINITITTAVDSCKLFLQEFLEIIIVLFIYSVLIKTKFDMYNAVKIAIILSLLSTVLETYNPILRAHIKSGIFSGLGGNLIKI